MRTTERQFDLADREIEKTAERIAAEIGALLDRTAQLHAVAPDYVIDGLVVTLVRKNPAAMTWLDTHSGEGSMRLSAALQDWVDQPQVRGVRSLF